MSQVIFLFALLILSLQQNFGDAQQKLEPVPVPPVRYVRGVYEVPQSPNNLPVIYDGYFPLVYEFTLPSWDPVAMKIQFWKLHNNCTTSDDFKDGYPCPIMHHFNGLIDNFVGNMTLWKNLFLDDPINHHDTGDSAENEDLDHSLLFSSNHSQIQDQEYYCSKIVPHFANFQTTREKMKAYYKLLDKCERDMVKLKFNLSDTATKLEDIYHTTFNSFVSNYWDKLDKMGQKQVTALGMWTTLETTLMLHQFMETQKWSQAIQSCQQSQIPWTIIDHDSLTSGIELNIHTSHYQLAIPLNEMSKYFKLPLTDCVFVEKDVLVVRILVPFRQYAKEPEAPSQTPSLTNDSKSPYKLIKFEPIVFHEKGEFCYIDGIQGQKYIADSLHPGNLFSTDCSDQEQKLCRISLNHYSSHDAAGPCAQALYSDDEEEILDSCVFKCLPADTRHFHYKYFNFFHTSDDNFIYSLGDDELALKIKCEGKEEFKLDRLDFGAWNLTLPCNCEIKGKNSRNMPINFEITAPCHNTFIVEKIRPYQWRNSLTKTSEAISRDEAELGFSDDDELVQFLDQRYGAYTFHYVILWLVILMLSLAVGMMGYYVFTLRKWKQEEKFRESRLIYSNVDGRGDINFVLERHASEHY